MFHLEPSLLTRLKQGDMAAFNEIYHHYAPKLTIRITKLVKKQDIVEEIIQDVFLKLWLNKEKVDPERGFVSFLNHIADNLAVDFFRKMERDKNLQLEIWASSVALCYDVEDKINHKESQSMLLQAIDSLTPKRREILLLNKFQDKSYKEIADQLGISVSTVSNQLVNALKDIKEFIRKNYSKELIISYLSYVLFGF